jgi:putative hydrolase of the HAD superfamily
LNVIFDLGGVVFNWKPEKLIADTIENKDIHDVLLSGIFKHQDWVELDRGVLSEKDAIKRGSERTGLPESDINRLMEAVPPFLTPIKESVKLIRDLKNQNNRLFVLSNMHLASINHLENAYSFWDLFDGRVVSCRIHKVKPDLEIYHHLIDTYQLDVNNSVFIDDTDINVEVANNLGMKTIKFESPDQCRRELAKLGCLS